MLQVVTKEGNAHTFPEEYSWYKDRNQNAIIIYREQSDEIWVFAIDEVNYFYAGSREVNANGLL